MQPYKFHLLCLIKLIAGLYQEYHHTAVTKSLLLQVVVTINHEVTVITHLPVRWSCDDFVFSKYFLCYLRWSSCDDFDFQNISLALLICIFGILLY